MIEMLQILLHRAYKLMCHQLPKTNSNIHSLVVEVHFINFHCHITLICKLYVVKLVVALAFSPILLVRKKETKRAYKNVSVVMFPKKLGSGPDKLFIERDL